MAISPSIGTRISLAAHLGSIRYVGSVNGTQGTWLGIEWDDPQRGKHDGMKDGKRYFTCLIPNSGSFIRPNAKGLSYGVSFLTALTAKYIELPHNIDPNAMSFGKGKETVILGSSSGAIEVEVVGLDKVRSRLSKLEGLKEVSLDGEEVARAEEEGVIQERCPGIRGLDLSKNLLPSWDVVALIAGELHYLERLALNSNRLQIPSNAQLLSNAFRSLTELQINTTLVKWDDLMHIIRNMPKLKVLEAGYNMLAKLTRISHNADDTDAPPATEGLEGEYGHPTLELLNLDANILASWLDVVQALQSFPSLSRLVLASNSMSSIPTYDVSNIDSKPLATLKHLSLSFNPISTWSSIDALRGWCPTLEVLNVREIPLVEDPQTGRNARQFLTARLPSLTNLDGAPIHPKERRDCEIFYMSYISQYGPADDEERDREFGRWLELVEKYGRPDELNAAQRRVQGKQHDTLSNKLIQINVHLPTLSTPTPMRVLPTMSLRTFRLKLMKTLKSSSLSLPPTTKLNLANVRLSLRMPDGTETPLDVDQEGSRDLEWFGVDEGADLSVQV